MSKKCYISGPSTGHDLKERKDLFYRKANELKAQSYIPVNPFENRLEDNAKYHDHMKADLKMLLDCQIIFMMDGWQKSSGCNVELDVAVSTGIKVIYEKQSNP